MGARAGVLAASVVVLFTAGCAATPPPPAAPPPTTADTVHLALEATSHPWQSMPATKLDDTAKAVCESVKLSGRKSLPSVARSVADNPPQPRENLPTLTYDQALQLQTLFADIYCPTLK